MSPIGRLLALTRAWVSGAAPERAPVDDAVLELARRQRLLPILYDLASRAGWEELAARARPDFYRTLLVNQGLLAAADRATAALAEAGVRVVRLKGSELLHGIYSNPGLRPMDDIDLLVRPEDVEPAMAALEARGFHPPEGQLPLAFYRQHHFHVALVEADSGAYLELHWRLMDRFHLDVLDVGAAIDRAPAVAAGRPQLGRRLDDHLGFVYLALHVDKHGPFHEVLLDRAGAEAALLHPSSEARLVWFVDLVRVLDARAIEPSRVAELARSLRVERSLAVTLEMAAELLARPDLAAIVPRPTDGRLRRAVGRATGRLLTARSPRLEALLDRAVRMDPAVGIRPLRLLHLPLELLADDAGGGWSGSLSRLSRGLHLGWDVLRHRRPR